MPRKPAKVISGARSPEDSPARLGSIGPGQGAQAAESQQSAPAVPTDDVLSKLSAPRQRKPGEEVVYNSLAEKLMIQLAALPDTKDPATGRVIPGKVRQARFKDHTYRTKDDWEIAELEKCEGYGLGKQFWRADEAEREAAMAVYNNFVETVRSNPLLRDVLKKDLAASDFKIVDALSRTPSKVQEVVGANA